MIGDYSYLREFNEKIDQLVAKISELESIWAVSYMLLSMGREKPEKFLELTSKLFAQIQTLVNMVDSKIEIYGDELIKKEWEEVKKEWLKLISSGGDIVGTLTPARVNNVVNKILRIKDKVMYRIGFLPRERGYSLAERLGELLSIPIIDDVYEEIKKALGKNSS